MAASNETFPRAIRLTSGEWHAFRQLQRELQERTPHATVTVRDTFRWAVGSASAVIAAGGTPLAPDLPREAPPPSRDPTT